jgi:hypothetical protein
MTSAPLLFARTAHLRLDKGLICMGGLGYAADVEGLCLELARRVDAAVTLLHVVDAITYDYPIAQEVQDHWQHILTTDTPQGDNLRTALERAQARVEDVKFLVRQGR